MRICVAGAYGAFGIKHLDALAVIDEVTVTSVMGPTRAKIDALAAERGIGHAATDLDECLSRDDVDAVILATPTQIHAEQAIACMKAGKPVLIEIPMADSLEDSEAICKVQKETGVLAMAGQVQPWPAMAGQGRPGPAMFGMFGTFGTFRRFSASSEQRLRTT